MKNFLGHNRKIKLSKISTQKSRFMVLHKLKNIDLLLKKTTMKYRLFKQTNKSLLIIINQESPIVRHILSHSRVIMICKNLNHLLKDFCIKNLGWLMDGIRVNRTWVLKIKLVSTVLLSNKSPIKTKKKMKLIAKFQQENLNTIFNHQQAIFQKTF